MTMDELLLQAVEQRLLRPLDVQFALMVAQEAHPAVKLTAAILSRDAGEGHVCLPISRLAEDELLSAKAAGLSEQILELTGAPDGWLPLLNDAEAVSGGERPTPMILCGERLYLNRMWRNELTVARFSMRPIRCWRWMKPGWLRRSTRCFRPLRKRTGKSGGCGRPDPTDFGDFRRSGHR